MKKIFALILALLLLIPAIVACKPTPDPDDTSSSSSSEDPSSTGGDSSSPSEDPSSTGGEPVGPGGPTWGDGNGFTSKETVITTWPTDQFNVLVTRYGATAGAPWGQMELNPTSFGDAINQAHIDRQAMIFDTYGVTVNYIEARDNQNVASDITTAMTSKETTYEVAYPRAQEGQALVSLIYDMNHSEYLDFSHSYFSQAAYESFTVCERTLFAAGDMDFSDNQVAYMIFVNKDMLDDVQEGLSAQLYTQVKNGTWTYDMLKNLSKQVKGNIGDPEQGDEDIYGYGTKNVARFFAYAGIKEADVDPDTGMYRIALDLDEEKIDTVIANIIECKTGTDWARTNWGGQWGANATPAFTEGRVLFFEEVAHQIDNIGSIDFALGVVPFPKLNEEQENYALPVTNVQATFVCIPKCSVSKEMSCYFVDVLAWTGSETIMEAYYEKFEAKMGIDTAEEDMEIVKDYIMANIMYDAGELTCGWSGFLGSVKTGSYANNTNNFTQVFGEAQEQAEITIGSWNTAWGSYYEEVE